MTEHWTFRHRGFQIWKVRARVEQPDRTSRASFHGVGRSGTAEPQVAKPTEAIHDSG